MTGRRVMALCSIAVLAAMGLSGAALARSAAVPRPPAIEVYPLGCCTHSALGQVLLGPDGNIWWTDWTNGDIVGYVTPAGTVKIFHFKGTNPRVLGRGPDGNIWFTSGNEGTAVKLYRVHTNGTGLTHFIFDPPWCIYCDGSAIVPTTKIGRMTLTGHVTEFPLPAGAAGGIGVVQGHEGSVWIALNATGGIARITPNAPCAVLNLVGKTVPAATALATHAHCNLSVAPGAPAGKTVVATQSTAPGFGLTSRDKVTVTLKTL